MTLIHLTKATASGAGRTHEQEGRCTLAVALTSVGAAAFFADGVDVALLDDALDFGDVAGFADRRPS
jgi:hypothetical protein